MQFHAPVSANHQYTEVTTFFSAISQLLLELCQESFRKISEVIETLTV